MANGPPRAAGRVAMRFAVVTGGQVRQPALVDIQRRLLTQVILVTHLKWYIGQVVQWWCVC